MLNIFLFVATLFFLVGSFFLTAIIAAFRKLNKKEWTKSLQQAGSSFFYEPFHRRFFPFHEYESLFFSTVCAQNLARFGYVAFGTSLLILNNLNFINFPSAASTPILFWAFFYLITLILGSFLIGDYLPKLFGSKFPEKTISISLFLASIYYFLAFPLSFIFLKISQSISRDFYFDAIHEPASQAKQEIIDLIQDAEVSPTLDIHDKKLIESVLRFKERTAKEVMVPRINVFSLSADTSIKDAAEILQKEGYSRTPVFRNSVDNIVGVLMYKDVLKKYMEYAKKNDIKILEAPIETIQKNILYTPETKKISSLLQEFRKKQVHFAIVVDEYGGTEGIVTIEDILEEIVGDIADEYDQEEEEIKQESESVFIVDAKANIWDVEEQLNIQIPQEEEYDTLAGYIFQVAGTIPEPGFVIHSDDFELEILKSNERSVEKVRIKTYDK